MVPAKHKVLIWSNIEKSLLSPALGLVLDFLLEGSQRESINSRAIVLGSPSGLEDWTFVTNGSSLCYLFYSFKIYILVSFALSFWVELMLKQQ